MRQAALSCWCDLCERLTRGDSRWSVNAIFSNLSCC